MRWASTLLEVAGVGLVAVSVGWMFPPAGLLVAGVYLVIAGIALGRDREPAAARRKGHP